MQFERICSLFLILLLVDPTIVTGFMHQKAMCKKEHTSHKYSSSSEEGDKKLSVAIVGSGAVGCYYGARLHETNLYDVIFHMRGDHYNVSKECGLKVTSVDGDVFIPPQQLNAYNKTKDIGTVDWVILALKSTGIDSVPALLEPLLRQDTRVICIMNGFVDEDIIRLIEGEANKDVDPTLTKCAAIYAGMAFLCSNRVAPGHVDHSYFGKLCASLTKSSSDSLSEIENHARVMVDLWEPTKIDFDYDTNYIKARWMKNVWNLPFNGISVAMNGITVDKIVTDPGLRKLAFTIMDETIAIANKELESRGYPETEFLGELEVRFHFR